MEAYDLAYTKFWIDKAEDIKNSGRWSSINQQIQKLENDPILRFEHFGEDQNEWILIVFSSLCAQVLEEYKFLKKAYSYETIFNVSEIAWRTRNLLELYVWSGFCSHDIKNARLFYEDAGLDMKNLAESFIQWGNTTNQGEEWILNFSESKNKLQKNMAEKDMNVSRTKYTEVRDAAKEIGFENHFKICNRTLSKFAHPTAALILRPKHLETGVLKNSFFAQGCMFFCGAFDLLEIGLKGRNDENL